MKTKTVILRDIPTTVDLEIGKATVDYSVAICRVRGNAAETFVPLGSGTFVIRDGMHGILTAHHCLHACSPTVSIGADGKDTLLLMVTRSRCVILDPNDAREHPLSVAESAVSGPDLTFIEIFPGPKLDLLKAIVSFWNLNQKHQELANRLSSERPVIAVAGFPEVDYRTTIIVSDIHHNLRHVVFIGALGDEDIREQEGWDYIDSRCKYSVSENVPPTFKGVSGGGIWAARLKATKDDVWKVNYFCLIGVAFYETEKIENTRHLRGHFIRSIYEIPWHNWLRNR